MNFLCYAVVEISLTKNIERKKKEQIQGRTNRRRLILNPMIQLAIVNLYTKYEVSILNGFRDILTKNYSPECIERKKSEHIYMKEQAREGWSSISRYNLSLSTCIQNMNFMCYIVVEISLTKNIEIEKRTNTEKNMKEKAHSKSHDTTCHCQPVYQIRSFYVEWF